jgi:hypothetical protein
MTELPNLRLEKDRSEATSQPPRLGVINRRSITVSMYARHRRGNFLPSRLECVGNRSLV